MLYKIVPLIQSQGPMHKQERTARSGLIQRRCTKPSKELKPKGVRRSGEVGMRSEGWEMGGGGGKGHPLGDRNSMEECDVKQSEGGLGWE